MPNNSNHKYLSYKNTIACTQINVKVLIQQGLQWQKDFLKALMQYNCPSIGKWINQTWH